MADSKKDNLIKDEQKKDKFKSKNKTKYQNKYTYLNIITWVSIFPFFLSSPFPTLALDVYHFYTL